MGTVLPECPIGTARPQWCTFSLTLRYRCGIAYSHADSLSRMYTSVRERLVDTPRIFHTLPCDLRRLCSYRCNIRDSRMWARRADCLDFLTGTLALVPHLTA